MADDVSAQSLQGGILRPSGKQATNERIADKVRAYDTGDERARQLVERRMNWAGMTQAQRSEWLMDAVTFLLAESVQERIAGT